MHNWCFKITLSTSTVGCQGTALDPTEFARSIIYADDKETSYTNGKTLINENLVNAY